MGDWEAGKGFAWQFRPELTLDLNGEQTLVVVLVIHDSAVLLASRGRGRCGFVLPQKELIWSWYHVLIPLKASSLPSPQSMYSTAYVATPCGNVSTRSSHRHLRLILPIVRPYCANLVPIIQFGRAHFSCARRLYRRSNRNWCFSESFVKSGGQVRLAL